MKKVPQFRPNKPKAKKFSMEKKETGRAKGYDKDWEAYRFRFLHANKRCYACGFDAKVVDHIRAHKGDKELFENTHNHIPLCISCHNFVTGRFDKYPEPKTEEKCKWLVKNREMLRVNVSVKVIFNYKRKR